MWRVLLVAVLAGCFEPDLQRCGELACAPEQVCIDEVRCVSPAAVKVCEASEVGTNCTVGGLPGRCADHGAVRVCDPATCGDGVVDEPLKEDCDGPATLSVACTELGFDLGRPTCSSTCRVDPATCELFGWSVLINTPVQTMWTDGTTLAYGGSDPLRLEVHGGGYDVSVAGEVRAFAAGGGVIFAAIEQMLVRVETTSVTNLSPPAGAFGLTGLDADATGALYALYDCDVYKYTGGGWTTLIDTIDTGCSVLHVANGHIYVAKNNGQIDGSINELMLDATPHYDAGPTVPEGVRDFQVVGNKLYIASPAGFTVQEDVLVQQLVPGSFRQVAVNGSYIYAVRTDGRAVRWDGAHADGFTPPTVSLAVDGHGGLYSYTGPIYRYSGKTFGDLAPIPISTSGDHIMTAISLDDSSVVVASMYSLSRISSDGFKWDTDFALSPTAIHTITGRSDSRLAASTDQDGGGGAMPQVWRTNSFGSWDVTAPISTAPIVEGLWLAPDDLLFAVGHDGTSKAFLGTHDASTNTWVHEEMVAGCKLWAVSGVTSSLVVAVGECGGVGSIWSLNGSTWSELRRATDVPGPFRSVLVLPNGDIFAAGDVGTTWRIAGTWTTDASLHGRALSGTANDVWISGVFTTIEHWDGLGWTPMTTRSLERTAIVAQPNRIVMPGGAPGHVMLLR